MASQEKQLFEIRGVRPDETSFWLGQTRAVSKKQAINNVHRNDPQLRRQRLNELPFEIKAYSIGELKPNGRQI